LLWTLHQTIDLRTVTIMNSAYITHLSTHIAEHGTAAVERDLRQLARYARRHGVAVDAARLMADRASPQVVRQRAFAVVCSALSKNGHGRGVALALAS
jgi:hypothetical protein